MAEAAKKRGIHRIASLADDYDKEHDIQPLAHQPQIPEESVEEHDAPLVPNPKPLKDFRSLPPSRMETRDLISLYWQDVAAAQAQKVSHSILFVCMPTWAVCLGRNPNAAH